MLSNVDLILIHFFSLGCQMPLALHKVPQCLLTSFESVNSFKSDQNYVNRLFKRCISPMSIHEFKGKHVSFSFLTLGCTRFFLNFPKTSYHLNLPFAVAVRISLRHI